MQVKVWVPTSEVHEVMYGKKPSHLFFHRPATWPKESLVEVSITGEQYKQWTGRELTETRPTPASKVLLKG
jgi:hypothetical protein